MLSTTIFYKEKLGLNLKEIFNSHKLVQNSDHSFSYISTENKSELVVATISPIKNTAIFTFGGNLSFKEYEQVHNLITTISQEIKGVIDDSNSLLGYLENGEPAYIVKNWNSWTIFLNRAKHISMEGQKVRILNEDGNEIATGLLVGYEVDPSSEAQFSISSCTLVTTFGERTFSGSQLSIEPTGEW